MSNSNLDAGSEVASQRPATAATATPPPASSSYADDEFMGEGGEDEEEIPNDDASSDDEGPPGPDPDPRDMLDVTLSRGLKPEQEKEQEAGAGGGAGDGGKGGALVDPVRVPSSLPNPDTEAGVKGEASTLLDVGVGQARDGGDEEEEEDEEVAEDEDEDEEEKREEAKVMSTSAVLSDYGELLHPHTFAVQLLKHDLHTLPAHQKAVRWVGGAGQGGGGLPGG